MTGISAQKKFQSNCVAGNSKYLLSYFFIFLSFFAQCAYACGPDPLIVQPWKLDHRELSDDTSRENELPFLSPGNDTRTNLQLIMMGLHPWKFDNKYTTKNSIIVNRFDVAEKKWNLFEPALFSLAELGDAFCIKQDQSARLNTNLKVNNNTAWGHGEGTRCNSAKQGQKDFIDAVQTNITLTVDEKKKLIASRENLQFNCNTEQNIKSSSQPNIFKIPDYTPKDTESIKQISDKYLSGITKPSKIANDFARYISAAKSFYDGDFDYANDQYAKLLNSDSDWIKETSFYMIGRNLLNKAQIDAFNDLSGEAIPHISDTSSLALAEDAFKKYLTLYPNGKYSQSANGLIRRLYWLGGDGEQLSDEYGKLIKNIGDPNNNIQSSDLSNEIDQKYLSNPLNELNNPFFISIQSLQKMRLIGEKKPDFPENELDEYKKYFIGQESLFAYLKAARSYYVDKDLVKSQSYLDESEKFSNQSSFTYFSRQVLRGQILMAKLEYRKSAEHWSSLLQKATLPWEKEAVELGLAISWEKLGVINNAFNNNTRLSSPRLRTIILRFVAGPELLREAVKNSLSSPEEKAVAKYTLLFKEATRGKYAEFLNDFVSDRFNNEIETPTGTIRTAVFSWTGSKKPYNCPSLKIVINQLSKDPKTSHGLLCLAEFIRVNDLDLMESVHPEADELGGGTSFFPGEIFSRGEIYKRIIIDKSTPDNDRAYALYRAINCYGPSAMNSCGGTDVNIQQRKDWFNLLKTKYGVTPWAQSLKYYW